MTLYFQENPSDILTEKTFMLVCPNTKYLISQSLRNVIVELVALS